MDQILEQNWLHGRHRRIDFPGHITHVVTCLQFDNEKIISGSDDNFINVYDTATGQLRKVLNGHQGGVWALQYVDNTLVSGSTDRTVRVWDIERGECTHIFQGHTSTVRCLQILLPTNMNPDPNEPPRFEPPEALIVTGSRDSSLKVWKLPDPRKDKPFLPELNSSGPGDDQGPPNPWLRHTLSGHSHSVRTLAAQGNLLVSGSYDNSIRVWNTWTGKLLHHMEGHSGKVYSVVLDYHRGRCMSGGMDGTVRIWSLEDGTCISVLEGHSMLVGLIGLTPWNLVSAGVDTNLRVWNAQTLVCEHVLSGHQGAITYFQHDERKVISGSEGGVKMWDIKTGKFVRDLLSNVDGVWNIAFDERRCVCAVHKDGHTGFVILDYGVEGLEDYNSTEEVKLSGSH